MVQWSDDAVVLSTSQLGEGGMIVHVLTRNHGRAAGMVRGTKKYGPICQMGNQVEVTWRARLEAQLGQFSLLESKQANAPVLAMHPHTLAAFGGLSTMLYQFLPERDPYTRLFDALLVVLQSMRMGADAWYTDYVAFELLMLQELGHALQLSECAASGTQDDLCYVSPKSGAAVSRAYGDPYKQRMLPLPKMLAPDCPRNYTPPVSEIIDALRMSGYFLTHHMANHYHISLPDSRDRFLQLLQRQDSADV